MGALAGFLPLKLCRKVGKTEHHLVRGVVEGTLPFLEVEEYPDLGIEDLLESVCGLDLFTTEARFLKHNEDLKRGTRFERIHKSEEPRSLDEFRTGYTVITVDVLPSNGPAFSSRVGLPMLNLLIRL